ncbi:MAG: DNA ligase-like domain-containing protein [Planctomycetota bacterium]|jgi:hypothetical protein
MPVRIARRNNNETVACFDTRQEAIAQMVAIEASKAMRYDSKAIIVDVDGLRHMLLLTSNSFRDREEDIVKSTGLREYAEGKTKTKPEDNVLLFWHDGEPIGDIIYAEFYKSFLIEVARERPNERINIGTEEKPIKAEVKQVWDFIESTPGKWGASHGFDVIGKSKDGIIYPIDKKESSVVLNEYQANWYTISEVL